MLLDQAYEGRTMMESCCACGGGDNRKMMTNILKSWKMVIFGHIAADVGAGEVSSELWEIPESTCDFANDACPEMKQFDHICDDTLLNEQCIGGDWLV